MRLFWRSDSSFQRGYFCEEYPFAGGGGASFMERIQAGKASFRIPADRGNGGSLGCGFFVPLYAYFYLPPFDFLPYNVGTEIGAKNAVRLYDSGFNEVTETVFAGDKPTYMVGLKEEITLAESSKLTALHEAYEN